MVVAAGNELTDACYRSPASTQYGYDCTHAILITLSAIPPISITVSASDSADDFAYFSNYGTCVDIIAPVGQSFHFATLIYVHVYTYRGSTFHQLGSMVAWLTLAVITNTY